MKITAEHVIIDLHRDLGEDTKDAAMFLVEMNGHQIEIMAGITVPRGGGQRQGVISIGPRGDTTTIQDVQSDIEAFTYETFSTVIIQMAHTLVEQVVLRINDPEWAYPNTSVADLVKRAQEEAVTAFNEVAEESGPVPDPWIMGKVPPVDPRVN